MSENLYRGWTRWHIHWGYVERGKVIGRGEQNGPHLTEPRVDCSPLLVGRISDFSSRAKNVESGQCVIATSGILACAVYSHITGSCCGRRVGELSLVSDDVTGVEVSSVPFWIPLGSSDGRRFESVAIPGRNRFEYPVSPSPASTGWPIHSGYVEQGAMMGRDWTDLPR